MKCREVIDLLEKLSPKEFASKWDNVGLLVGRKDKEVKRIMVSLDASVPVVDKAVKEKVDMLITHHPMIFSSVKQINEDTPITDKVLTLAENRISYYAMHTNFDTVGGMGELAAGPDYLNLSDTRPLLFESDDKEGMGRGGRLPSPMTGEEAAIYVKEKFNLPFVMLYQNDHDKETVFERMAVLPGSGKGEMELVKDLGYDLYLTGDFGHHPGIDGTDMGMTIIDATHYGLEKIFVSFIAGYLKNNIKGVEILEVNMGCPIKII